MKPRSPSPPQEDMTCPLGRGNGGGGQEKKMAGGGGKERRELEKAPLSASSTAHAAKGPVRGRGDRVTWPRARWGQQLDPPRQGHSVFQQ